MPFDVPDTPITPLQTGEENTSPDILEEPSTADQLRELQDRVQGVQDETLRALATDELAEYERERGEASGARQEFLDDIRGIQMLEENFGDFEGFDVFV